MAVLFSFLHLVWTLDLPIIRVHITRIFLAQVFHPCLSHHHCQEHHHYQVNVCIADDFQEHISRLNKPLNLIGSYCDSKTQTVGASTSTSTSIDPARCYYYCYTDDAEMIFESSQSPSRLIGAGNGGRVVLCKCQCLYIALYQILHCTIYCIELKKLSQNVMQTNVLQCTAIHNCIDPQYNDNTRYFTIEQCNTIRNSVNNVEQCKSANVHQMPDMTRPCLVGTSK